MPMPEPANVYVDEDGIRWILPQPESIARGSDADTQIDYQALAALAAEEQEQHLPHDEE